MKAARSIRLNTVLLAIGGIFRQVTFFAATVLFARQMPADEFGVATLWYAVTLILIGVADWGTRFTGWTTVARAGLDSAAISCHLSTKLVMSAVVAMTFFVGLALLKSYVNSVSIMLPLVSLLFFNQLTVEWIFRGLSDFVTVLAMNVIAGIVLFGLAMRIHAQASANAYLWAILISNLSAVVYGTVLLVIRGLSWRYISWSKIAGMIGTGSEFALVSVVNRSYANFSIVALGIVALPVVVSSFRLGHMLFMFVSTLSYYIVGAVYSIFAAGGVSKDEFSGLFSRMLGFSLIFFLMSFIGSNYIAEPLVIFAFGVEYIDAIPMLKTMMWILPIGFLGMFVREFAPALGVGKGMLVISLGAISVGTLSIAIFVYSDSFNYLPVALGLADIVVIIFGVMAIYRRFEIGKESG
jgi:O-antigen/teichoic acid export membrane protein